MTASTHVIEKQSFSGFEPAKAASTNRLRRLMWIGLAAAIALATLAPVIVLASA
jgi:hypothetical protein